MKIQTKITAVAASIAVASTFAFGATILKYFSPNNDGVRDVLEFPFSATDDGRIVSWKMVIENSRGKIIRTIGNKTTLPEKITASSVLKQIGKAKESVIIPESVIWDGTMDDGTIAPDGEYFYYLSLTDEKGNESKTKKYNVFIDNIAPKATVTVPEGDALVFGEGAKAVFHIKQTGTQEKKWTAEISDKDGNVVRTVNWENLKPSDFTWDGTDDKGMIVPDGIYNYVLTGEDRAGNISNDASIKNIIFSAEKPAANITINGSKYFSVPEKSTQTKITFDVDIPSPTGSANKLVDWNVVVCSKDGTLVRTYNAETLKTKNPVSKIEFDGKDDSGKIIPEGEYFARVSARYLNGYETQPVNTSVFVFDITPPEASVISSGNIFSPDGDGRKDFMNFKFSAKQKGGSPLHNWNMKIVNVKNPEIAVLEFNYGGFCPTEFTWNGLDKNGKIAQDGEYDLILTGSDMAGNTVVQKTAEHFVLDTSKTEVMLASSDLIFSPNDDGVQDSITFTPVIKDSQSVAKYRFEIKNKNGTVVYQMSGSSKVPAQIVWNGKDNANKVLPDGKYSASLTIDSTNGSQAKVEVPEIILDTVAPSVELSAEYLIFSPDGDGNKDEFVLTTKNCSEEDLWTVSIENKNGRVVREYKFNKTIAGSVNASIAWDGTDEAGNKVPDGTYSVSVKSEDKAGNKFARVIDKIVLDTRPVKVYVTAEFEGISPLSQTGLTAQKFNIRTSVQDGIKSWKFDVADEKGNAVYSVFGDGQNKVPPKEILWDGKTKDQNYAEGLFYGRLSMEYEKGNKVLEKSPVFVCSSVLPRLSVKTYPEFFSPDNDGTGDELSINLQAQCSGKLAGWSFVIFNPEESGKKDKPFWKVSGTNKFSDSLLWNGLSNVSKEKNGQAERVQSAMDYPWEFTVTDSLGLTSKIRGKISIDILVIRDGNVLKMAVPAILFRANHADFKTAKEAPGSKITVEQAQNNERVLKRVAEVLQKFPDYTITIVGHANNTTGTEAEETSTANGNIPLIPLSKDRADFVKSRLVEYGIDERRMKTEGKGGRERIAALNDRENWWKNRRVEFLLHK